MSHVIALDLHAYKIPMVFMNKKRDSTIYIEAVGWITKKLVIYPLSFNSTTQFDGSSKVLQTLDYFFHMHADNFIFDVATFYPKAWIN